MAWGSGDDWTIVDGWNNAIKVVQKAITKSAIKFANTEQDEDKLRIKHYKEILDLIKTNKEKNVYSIKDNEDE